jgi:hypothetical protein
MAGGRPTDYSQAMLDAAEDYIITYKDEHGDAIPSIAGLACVLGVSKSTVYLWRDTHHEFSDTLNRILTWQERDTLNGGITGVFNPTISKLILANHGYTDDKIPEPQPINITIANPHGND